MGALAVILLGPPGAGKGTQGRMLEGELGFPKISTGDILREALKERTELGKKAQVYMESGNLVPDELVDAIARERIKRQDCARGFILDGFPRTISQAEYLESLFREETIRSVTIGIQVPDRVLVERLSGRWTCPACGKMFHEKSNPSKAGKLCDECGAVLVTRKDDSVEVVEERLQVYHRETEPLIRFYRSRARYQEVDGDRPAPEIFRAVLAIVKDSGAKPPTQQ
jgi:adenylate kinase